jgi:steroid 5-alpha reductase family enzyme
VAVLPLVNAVFLTFRENAYLAPVVKLQEERAQSVVRTGPYRYVRHPMYFGAPECLWLSPAYTSCSGAVLRRAAIVPRAPLKRLELLSQAPDEIGLRCPVPIVQLVGVLT